MEVPAPGQSIRTVTSLAQTELPDGPPGPSLHSWTGLSIASALRCVPREDKIVGRCNATSAEFAVGEDIDVTLQMLVARAGLQAIRVMLAATVVFVAACPNTPTPPIIPPGPYTPGQS